MNEKPKNETGAGRLQFFQRMVYGTLAVYPTGKAATALTRLTGRKTVNKTDIEALRDLGLEMEFVQDPLATAAGQWVGSAR